MTGVSRPVERGRTLRSSSWVSLRDMGHDLAERGGDGQSDSPYCLTVPTGGCGSSTFQSVSLMTASCEKYCFTMSSIREGCYGKSCGSSVRQCESRDAEIIADFKTAIQLPAQIVDDPPPKSYAALSFKADHNDGQR